jgi:outer membrane protein TolC
MSRKRWVRRTLAGLLALGSAGGCAQQVFIDPADYRDAVTGPLPPGLENRPHDAIAPSPVDRLSVGPATVLDPDRPGRMVTLQECVAVALEQGNVGSQSPTNLGFKLDTPNQFTGQGVTGSDSIRVFAVDPAIVAANLERSLSKFDTRFVASMSWQKVDEPTPVQFVSFQQQRDAAQFTTSLVKPLPTGGTAGITFSTDYSKFPSQAAGVTVNPNYTPRLQFTFEQPLLRLFGVEINQLSPNHPGSNLLNVGPSGGQGTEGILISRIRVDQQRAEFDRQVNFLLANVETAYWNLYAAYYNLYAQEEGLRQSYEGYRFIQARVDAAIDPPQLADQARAQFERFRRGVYETKGQVLEAERQLRGFLGVRSDDGTRLVPIDAPNEVGFQPDFYEAANEAMASRPELLQARQEVKATQFNLLLQKNLRKADVGVFGRYETIGLGTRLDGRAVLDGNVPGNALSSLVDNQFNSWTVGIRADYTLGARDANAQVKQAQLNLARSFNLLRDSEMKVLENVVLQYRQVVQAHTVIGPARAERKALQIFLAKTRTVIEIGRFDSAFYQNFLTVQRDLAQAIAVEFQAIANYNSALSALELAKGTIQRYNNVGVSEGPLPPWVQKKAADHIRERTEAALQLRDRAVVPPPGGAGLIGGQPVGPPAGSPVVDTLPPFARKRDPLPEALPDPRPGDKKMDLPAPPALPADPGKDGKPVPPGELKVPAALRPADAADGYFRPSGTVNFPPRGTTAPPASPAPPPAPFAPAMPPVPVPPSGR